MRSIALNLLKLICWLSLTLTSSLSVAQTVLIEKAFLYDKYTLTDSYPYENNTRQFQWDKINQLLQLTDTIQLTPAEWGILQNYKNKHGKAPLVKNYQANDYNKVIDAFNIEQSQGIPLYKADDLNTPERYGQDGDLIKIKQDYGDFIEVESIYFASHWMVPKQYVYPINNDAIDSQRLFNKAIFVDLTNQNITTLEKSADKWLVRSMNPATTGLHKPPYQMSTPAGIFVLQDKLKKMVFYKDGTTEIGGFAPNANRFSTGAYIHGVPVNLPRTAEIEFSSTLGTTPRSHKCVRNATSHAQFIYDWAPKKQTLVFVFD